MKYHQVDNALYIKNRKNFMSQMRESSIAVFNSNDIYPVSADSTMPFQQHRDILYLSGVDQEESILLLFPDSAEDKHKEVLFVRETNDHIAVWEGAKLTKERYQIKLLEVRFQAIGYGEGEDQLEGECSDKIGHINCIS